MKNLLFIFALCTVFASCEQSAKEQLYQYQLLKNKQQDTLKAFLQKDKNIFEILIELKAQEKIAKEILFNSVPNNKGNILHLSEKQINDKENEFNKKLDSLRTYYSRENERYEEMRSKLKNALSKEVQLLIPPEYYHSITERTF